MNATISMDGLWSVVDSLSLKNKQWLAEKLRVSLTGKKIAEEEKILAGIAKSVKEAKSGQTMPLESIWEQL